MKLTIPAALSAAFFLSCSPPPPELATSSDAIAAFAEISGVGHGKMFGADGTPIELSEELGYELQARALNRISERATEAQLDQLSQGEERIRAAAGASKSRGELNADLVEQAIEVLRPKNAGQLRSINNFLRWWYRQANGEFATTTSGLATNNSGAAYISECLNAGVPIPPDWGSPLWVRQGNNWLDPDFLDSGGAQVYTFESESPRGICYALPRINWPFISLLGIICQGNDTGRACFWDNQSNDTTTPIFLGVGAALSGFAGGAELEGGSGGICTSCHAGEDVFIVHPLSDLDRGSLSRSSRWVQPLVAASWPQNRGPSNVIDDIVPTDGEAACTSCHNANRRLRFPVLSPELEGYCTIILPMALAETMPPDPMLGDFSRHIAALQTACSETPADTDGDGTIDQLDNCKFVASSNLADRDQDGRGDICDDSDGDAILDAVDNCVDVFNPLQQNRDIDEWGDHCDDSDVDTVVDFLDNCWVLYNPDQLDSEGDDIGDVCDVDDDDDGVCFPGGVYPLPQPGEPPGRCQAETDNCPLNANRDQRDTDSDLVGDVCDSCPNDANTFLDTDNDGLDNACDQDDDGDGIDDGVDNCPLHKNPGQQDFNGNGIGQVCDPDEQVKMGPKSVYLGGWLRFVQDRFDRFQILLLPDLENIRPTDIPPNPRIELEVFFDVDAPMVIVDELGLEIAPDVNGFTRRWVLEPSPEYFEAPRRPGERTTSQRPSTSPWPSRGRGLEIIRLEVLPEVAVEPGRDYFFSISASPWERLP